jgi:hypothetical protein
MCPLCKSSGILVNSIFSACTSENCHWVGPTSSIDSERVQSVQFSIGCLTIQEKMFLDPMFSSFMKDLQGAYQNHANQQVDLNKLMSSDDSGSPVYIFPKGEKDLKIEERPDILAKIHLISHALDSLFFFHDFRRWQERDGPLDLPVDELRKIQTTVEGNVVKFESFGFPPVDYCFEDGNFSWEFSQKSKTWSPIDWSMFRFNKSFCTRLVGVFQTSLQNLTYSVQEDMESGEFFAGISERAPGEILQVSAKNSSATSVDEAVEKLVRHLNNLHNEHTRLGTPFHFSWSKEFGYEHEFLHVVGDVSRQKFFATDAKHNALKLLNSSFEEIIQQIETQKK